MTIQAALFKMIQAKNPPTATTEQADAYQEWKNNSTELVKQLTPTGLFRSIDDVPSTIALAAHKEDGSYEDKYQAALKEFLDWMQSLLTGVYNQYLKETRGNSQLSSWVRNLKDNSQRLILDATGSFTRALASYLPQFVEAKAKLPFARDMNSFLDQRAGNITMREILEELVKPR